MIILLIVTIQLPLMVCSYANTFGPTFEFLPSTQHSGSIKQLSNVSPEEIVSMKAAQSTSCGLSRAILLHFNAVCSKNNMLFTFTVKQMSVFFVF